MDFSYIACTEDKRIVKGKVSAANEETAIELLNYGGYRVLSLKQIVPLINKEKLTSRFSQIKPAEIVMFSRQLALLLESGTDIVTSLDLLQNQVTNQTLRKIVGEIASDIRGGTSLSVAMSKHPQAFSPMYYRTIAAGERGGNLEFVLRQMADYLEKGVNTQKQIKGALMYPIIVLAVAIVVVLILVSFVFPSFIGLYAQLGAQLPWTTLTLLAVTTWLNHHILHIFLGVLIAVAAAYAYIKSPNGRYQWDKLMLRLPVIGRIIHVSELARCCRTMTMLIRAGLPLPDVMAMTIHSTNNKVVAANLTGVQQDLIKGEGLSQPMVKRPIFLPLMTQMSKVGEQTGNLEVTLTTVAEYFEAEASEKTKAAVALIQPMLTIIIGLIIMFMVVSMYQAMYAIYPQLQVEGL